MKREPIHSHHLTCKELLTSIGDYVDGDASQELCQEIERHISKCENCRVVVDTLNKTIYLYHASAQETEVPADVRGRLFETLKLDDFTKRKS
jgi:predicted anti-sigma-YlaC factor YlaD